MAKIISTNDSMNMIKGKSEKTENKEPKEEPKGKYCSECGQLLPEKKE